MFEAKRTSKFIEFKAGKEIFKVYLGGIFQYKKFAEADEKVKSLLQNLKNKDIKETEELLGHAIMNEMVCIFGQTNADYLLQFYEKNYDEMLMALLPFIQNEYIPAMLENIKAISQNKLNEYK